MAEATLSGERERVIGVLRGHETELKQLGVAKLSLFGSTARGDMTPASDVDVLIASGPEPQLGLRFLELMEELGDELERPVNFAFSDTLQPLLRRRIEAEAIRVF
jgi:predicted nucleotidyltransferase